MNREVRALRDSDLVAISALLRAHSPGHRASRLADLDVLRWKYLSPGPAWAGPRAVVAEQDGAIVALAGVSPTAFRLPAGEDIPTLTIIDWVADPSAPGTGVAVFTKAMRLAECAFHFGGAAVTRSIVPRLGYRPAGEIRIYACWIRPWGEFRRRPKSPRAFARLAHGMVRRPRLSRRRDEHWQSTRVPAFDDRLSHILEARSRDRIDFRRSVASLNYWAEGPLVRTVRYLVHHRGSIAGYFMVAFVGWEARIVALDVRSEEPGDWTTVVRAILQTVRDEPEVGRVRVMSGIPILSQALERTGFWINERDVVSIFDPANVIPTLPINVQFAESDAGYI